MPRCRACGLDHGRLAVQIRGAQLQRTADKSRHMLRIGGGAWSFESILLVAHPEVRTIEIVDRHTGELWHTDRATFDANCFPFNGAGRAQQALALRHWKVNADALEPEDQDAEPVQPILAGMSSAQGIVYERARKPRPRIELPKRRRRWWG